MQRAPCVQDYAQHDAKLQKADHACFLAEVCRVGVTDCNYEAGSITMANMYHTLQPLSSQFKLRLQAVQHPPCINTCSMHRHILHVPTPFPPARDAVYACDFVVRADVFACWRGLLMCSTIPTNTQQTGCRRVREVPGMHHAGLPAAPWPLGSTHYYRLWLSGLASMQVTSTHSM
eukprot:1152788-Pelagomonas_calceolata.AAC.4